MKINNIQLKQKALTVSLLSLALFMMSNHVHADAYKNNSKDANKRFDEFKERPGIAIDWASKDKKASFTYKHENGANAWIINLTGNFDKEETQFATHDGLAGDAELSIKRNNIWNIEFNSKSVSDELGIEKLTLYHTCVANEYKQDGADLM